MVRLLFQIIASYLIADTPWVAVTHSHSDRALYLIRRCPWCLITLSIRPHFHIFMHYAFKHTHTYITDSKSLNLSSAKILIEAVFVTVISCLWRKSHLPKKKKKNLEIDLISGTDHLNRRLRLRNPVVGSIANHSFSDKLYTYSKLKRSRLMD